MIKYDFSCIIQIGLLILVLISISYVSNKIMKNINKKETFEDSYIDPVVPNQLVYWKGRKKGIEQQYEAEKFLEFDAQGDLKLTSRDETYKKYIGDGKNYNYYGPVKRNGKYVAIKGHSNIRTNKDTSIEECKNACDALQNCQGFNFNNNQCEFKYHSCANVPNECIYDDSGIRLYEKLETSDKLIEIEKAKNNFGEPVIDRTVRDSDVKHIKNTSLNNCLYTCTKNPRCAAISYNKEDKDCYDEDKTCKEAGSKCVTGDEAKGWQFFELSNSSDKGGVKNTYYPVKIGGKYAPMENNNDRELKAHSLDKCIAECDKYPKCKNAGWRSSDKLCQLSYASCREKPGDCKVESKWVTYEKNKYKGPFYIESREFPNWKSGGKYIRLLGSEEKLKGNGTNIIGISNIKDDYAKWYFHPDGRIQNVGNGKYIAKIWDAGRWKIRANKSKGHYWHWIEYNKGWGNIYRRDPIKRKIYKDNFLHIPYFKNEVYFSKEQKTGKRKNPDYTVCKTQSGKVTKKGSEYIYSGMNVSKKDNRSQWVFRKA